YVFKRQGILSKEVASGMNTLVFKVALPLLLFEQLATADFLSVWDTKFVLFCALATTLSIVLVMVVSRLIKNRSVRGEFVQAAYRSSAALLGVAFINNIYGESQMAALMIIGAVPIYNIMAVVVLSLTDPENEKIDATVIKKTLIGIMKNPIIVGIVDGVIWSVLKLPMPAWFNTYLSRIGSLSTPMGLIAMGAMIDLGTIGSTLVPSLWASFFKLIGLEALFLPAAVALGFQKEQLVAVMIMLGSATTVSCYVMARNMHHEGTLTSTTVAITTILSSFTLTFWLFLARSMGWI
ncbi:MAG: AEC family transporter, partial [Erysipelotrichaceae bacterium]|nr:AEC family transporter [Erysipelotrichaceae bacterium]